MFTGTVPFLLNGKDETSASTFPVVSPVSHSTIWSCSSASSADADAAVSAASAAFPIWSKTKPAARRTILLKAADLLEERVDELKADLLHETGALDFLGSFDVMTAAELVRDAAGRCSAIMGSIPICQDEGTSALVLKEPYGVVLAMAPWYVGQASGLANCLSSFYTGTCHTFSGSDPSCTLSLQATPAC